MKNVRFFENFRRNFPEQVDKSLDETAAFGKGRFMRSTAKGPTGVTRARWQWIRNGNWMRWIFNPLHYVRFLETGTGMFGPRHKRIFPKTAKALHWKALGKELAFKGSGIFQFRSKMGSKKGGYQEMGITVKSTAGMPAQPMISPNKEEIQRDLILRMRRTIRNLWRTAREQGAV